MVPSPLRSLDQRRWVFGAVGRWDGRSGRDDPLGEGSGWEIGQLLMHTERLKVT